MFPSLSNPLASIASGPGLGIATVESLVWLIVAAAIVGVVAHRIKLPYTVSLVLVGVALKALGLVPQLQLTRDLLMMVFLPALLFEAAIHFPRSELKQLAPSIAMLAAPGVLITAIFTALVLQFEFSAFHIDRDMTFSHFLLFGTIIAATDPISVIALLRQLGVSRKLSVLIEGESLFNDGTAIVLYSVVLSAIQSGSYSITDGLVQFVVVAIGGIFVGALLGLFANWVLSFAEDHLIAIALTTVTAYGTYLVAERLHVSGVLATVVAGLFVGFSNKRHFDANTRIAVVSFWEYAAFFITSLLFLLIGLEVKLPIIFSHATLIVFAFCAVLLSRALCVFLPVPLLRRIGQPITFRESCVVWWAGLRGSLSMVLVLSLPESMPARQTLIAMTFGVVVLSVVVQGSTVGYLLRLLSFVKERTQTTAFLRKSIARLDAIQARLDAIRHLSAFDQPLTKELAHSLQNERADILATIKEKEHDTEFRKAQAERVHALEEQLKQAARDSYRHSLFHNIINETEAAELSSELEAAPPTDDESSP